VGRRAAAVGLRQRGSRGQDPARTDAADDAGPDAARQVRSPGRPRTVPRNARRTSWNARRTPRNAGNARRPRRAATVAATSSHGARVGGLSAAAGRAAIPFGEWYACRRGPVRVTSLRQTFEPEA